MYLPSKTREASLLIPHLLFIGFWVYFVAFELHKQSRLQNCDVQFNNFSKKLEVAIKSYTKVDVAEDKFDVTEIGAQSINLSQL